MIGQRPAIRRVRVGLHLPAERVPSDHGLLCAQVLAYFKVKCPAVLGYLACHLQVAAASSMPRGSKYPIFDVSQLVSTAIPSMVFGTRDLKCWVLGDPLGCRLGFDLQVICVSMLCCLCCTKMGHPNPGASLP